LFLQQPFEAPEPETSLSVQVLSANLLMRGGRPGGFEYNVDEEIASVSFTGEVVLGDRLGLSLAVPVVVQYGGWLDPIIDGVEKLVGARSARRGTTSFQTVARFATADGRVLQQVGPAAALGDVTLGARWLLVRQDGLRPAVAVRAALKAPTGGTLAGSGTWDVGGGVLGGWEAGFFAAHVAFDVSRSFAAAASSDVPQPAAHSRVRARISTRKGCLLWGSPRDSHSGAVSGVSLQEKSISRRSTSPKSAEAL